MENNEGDTCWWVVVLEGSQLTTMLLEINTYARAGKVAKTIGPCQKLPNIQPSLIHLFFSLHMVA